MTGSVVAPTHKIKVGVLFDLFFGKSPEPWGNDIDVLDAMRIVFDEAFEKKLVDRPIEMVVKYCEGLPRGAVQDVIRTYQELVDEGCIVIYGPLISENAPDLAEYINEKGHVPAIGMMGTEDFLGEWTFQLSNGSLPDEPYVIASIMAQHGLTKIGVAMEKSMIGQQYLHWLRQACIIEGLEIVGVAGVAQTGEDMVQEITTLRDSGAEAVLHLGFGWAIMGINKAMREIGWEVPKYCMTAWEVSLLDEEFYRETIGWIGLEQFDEENHLAVEFLDKFEMRYGRRPEYFMPGYGADMGNIIVQALVNAHPLSPRGVRDGIKTIRNLPAHSGAPGTRISYGKYRHNGWMGAGFLIAREHAPDGPRGKTIFRGRIAAPRGAR
ncbi:hypothetical protein BSL82_11775 [Tardibacter chloracetimidivorans]|uniref:Leucine-binding protein domain-containing protein n=1 Tax=Tardibacter chloracetimidivorans TaxID=1921510 RepID=A0A1L3ZWB5_9SPHN|nr:ABC transporter substrate-binding protein [Tardibacter chloracetimidivorans]API59905.1 hypothetical protein BSL82_11775 [Tardibacter chloracetimidivorans]